MMVGLFLSAMFCCTISASFNGITADELLRRVPTSQSMQRAGVSAWDTLKDRAQCSFEWWRERIVCLVRQQPIPAKETPKDVVDRYQKSGLKLAACGEQKESKEAKVALDYYVKSPDKKFQKVSVLNRSYGDYVDKLLGQNIPQDAQYKSLDEGLRFLKHPLTYGALGVTGARIVASSLLANPQGRWSITLLLANTIDAFTPLLGSISKYYLQAALLFSAYKYITWYARREKAEAQLQQSKQDLHSQLQHIKTWRSYARSIDATKAAYILAHAQSCGYMTSACDSAVMIDEVQQDPLVHGGNNAPQNMRVIQLQ